MGSNCFILETCVILSRILMCKLIIISSSCLSRLPLKLSVLSQCCPRAVLYRRFQQAEASFGNFGSIFFIECNEGCCSIE